MAAKAIILFCVQAFLVQCAYSQCVGPVVGAGMAPGLAYDGYGLGGCAPLAPIGSFGGSFVVTSASPITPTGVTVISENIYEGALAVGGNLPLLGSVALEGAFPTAGAGAVSYGCGDGAVGIAAEDGAILTGIVAPAVAAPDYGAPYGVGYGAPYGFGYGAPYGVGCVAPYGVGYGAGYGLGYGVGYGLGYGADLYGQAGCEAVY